MSPKEGTMFAKITSEYTMAETILVSTIVNNASVLKIKPERAAAILQSFAACILVDLREKEQEEYTIPQDATLN